MSRRDRLRRVVILCRSFTVNLACFRAARRPEFSSLWDPQNKEASFWITAGNNFIDICVLEWCKLFADPKEKHHWYKIVSDPAKFQTELLGHLGIDAAAFDKEINVMRTYRDKFLAHLDSERVMHPPALDTAKKAVWFYHHHVVNHEAQHGDLMNLPLTLETGYTQCMDQVRGIYERNARDGHLR